MTWSRWRRLRQAAQIVFFALFVYLLFASLQKREAAAWADLFFRFNPLSALGAMLASRTWIPRPRPDTNACHQRPVRHAAGAHSPFAPLGTRAVRGV